ncbi:hypothetical protein [Nocardia sp. NBC_01009]|uniref:hypothetical protein n=1 Tax=Nocardia sp. NBC_01009 TaxID=2975996 RepID=UPI00386EB556|nr:cytochrome P450 [Nocardia sp. NBC_01009]
MVPEFPFAEQTSNELSFKERDERYERLHDWPDPTYLHSSGLRMIWKYDDVRDVLEAADPALSNRNSLDPLVGFPRIAGTPRAIPHFFRHLVPLPAKATANLTDDTLHKQVWDTMAGPAGHFTISRDERPQRIEAMVEHFHHALHGLDKGIVSRLDVTALSIAYAARVGGAAVGLPSADWPQVAVWSGAQSGLLGRRMRGRELAEAVGALGQLFTVSGQTVERSRRHRVTGFASRLRDAGVPRRVAVSAMANSLAAGVHTVSGSIQQGVQRLLSDPGREWWDLLADQNTAAQVAVKVLQLDPGLVAWKRRAVRPMTLRSGTELAAGPVLVMFAAANRDPAAFQNPLDLRGGGKLPLTFGFGKHVCPGKQLANLAIEVFLRELRELAPRARLSEEVTSASARKPDLLFSGADVTLTV